MLNFNNDVKYTKSNEWAKKFENFIRVGIDDYSQSSLGDIVHVEISEIGTHVEAGKPFGKIEATKSVSDINSPVSGVITKINNEVIENPGIINIAPFDEGWLIEIDPENISEFDALMDSGEYKKFISK